MAVEPGDACVVEQLGLAARDEPRRGGQAGRPLAGKQVNYGLAARRLAHHPRLTGARRRGGGQSVGNRRGESAQLGAHLLERRDQLTVLPAYGVHDLAQHVKRALQPPVEHGCDARCDGKRQPLVSRRQAERSGVSLGMIKVGRGSPSASHARA